MPSKASKEKINELRQLFNEIHQIAYVNASDIMKRALDEYKARFEELTRRKGRKDNGNDRS